MKIFMVVDDSPVIRKVARRILEGMDYVVIEAVDGLDALEKCSSNMPDGIIVDWDMPRMNGVEFMSFAVMRFRHSSPSRPSLMLSIILPMPGKAIACANNVFPVPGAGASMR